MVRRVFFQDRIIAQAKKVAIENHPFDCTSTVTSSTSLNSDGTSYFGHDDHSLRTTVTPCNNKNKRHRKRRSRRKTNGRKSQKDSAVHEQQQLSAEEEAKYVAVDCEMVGVGNEGMKSALARVTIVDWNGQIMFDEFVKPDLPVTDYRTFVSGITEQYLEGAMDLECCRSQVSKILEGKILIGHALKNDLSALRIYHPWQMTRDTAKYSPFMKVRFGDGILWPRKLKDLCAEKLHRNIQEPGAPHSAYEDAVAAMELYKLVRTKWEKAMKYKINKTKEIEQQERCHKSMEKFLCTKACVIEII